MTVASLLRIPPKRKEARDENKKRLENCSDFTIP